MPFPRIVAVYHGAPNSHTAEKMFQRLKNEVIDSLPVNSRVGLELDWSHPVLELPPRVKEIFSDRNFFARLARYAKEKGHTVVWMERPERFLEMEHNHLTELENALEKVERANHETEDGALAIGKAEEAYTRVGGAPTGTYRTLGMREVIENTPNWRGTDVVIAGAVHSHQLAGFLKKRVWRKVHPFSENVYTVGIRKALKQEKLSHALFTKIKT